MLGRKCFVAMIFAVVTLSPVLLLKDLGLEFAPPHQTLPVQPSTLPSDGGEASDSANAASLAQVASVTAPTPFSSWRCFCVPFVSESGPQPKLLLDEQGRPQQALLNASRLHGRRE
jgi:hypothetical protein